MTKLRLLTLLIVAAHCIVAVGHLSFAARILPAPNDKVSWLAIVLITTGHLCVSIALWTLNDKLAGWVTLLFFLAALGADLYEHFLQTAPNNIFMLTASDWTAWFDASVFGLLALEILACALGILSLRSGTRNSQPRVDHRSVVT